MDESIAGPSKPSSRSRSSKLGNTGSSDGIEEVPYTSKSRSRATRLVKETRSRLEHPQTESAEVSVTARTRRIPSRSAGGSSIQKPITTSSRAKEKGKGKEKAKQADKDPIVLVEGSTDGEDEDEDEPVFVGKSLAKKYSFKSGSIVKSDTSSSSSILITDEVKAESKRKPKAKLKADPDLKPNHPPLPLLAPVENVKPPPVPAWLGKTAILLQIPYCVVCKVRWKKENGAARWRHTSTCLPPLYRSPNPSPDLPQLVHQALIETSGASTPSLLELHVNASTEAVDNRVDRKGPKPPQKLKGLAKMINVRPAEDRGDMWEGEIEDRVTTMFGRPRTPEPRSPSAHSALPSPLSSPATAFQSTQPLGESALAEHYSREVSMADDHTFEATEDAEMDEVPMPPSSQQRPTDDDKENEDPQDLSDGPFRSRGGSRAEGDLPTRFDKSLSEGSSADIRMTPQQHIIASQSPMSSVTPKAINALRSRISLSVTPTPLAASVTLDSASDHSDWAADDDWGDDAMLEWHAEPGRARSEDEDDASSVAPGDAGLPVTDEDTEDEDAWGREAYLTWDSQITDEEAVEEAVDDSDLGDLVEETADDLTARGMPNYAEWTIKSLQKLCEGFGYRTITKHDALVDIAIQCWKALNPPVAPPPRLAFAPSSTSSSRSNSVSSADVPLSSTQKTRKAGPAGNVKPNAKGKSAAEPVPSTQQVVDLDQRFFRMIRDDEALWIRILRYEPIAFDELVSKAIAAGIDDRGWKARLKLFLDSQSVTFFTEDPTGTRRRH